MMGVGQLLQTLRAQAYQKEDAESNSCMSLHVIIEIVLRVLKPFPFNAETLGSFDFDFNPMSSMTG